MAGNALVRARANLRRSVARMEDRLPPTLGQFSRQVGARLGELEVRIEKASAPYRRRWARLLRDASHRLGRLEAEGEQRWKRLTTRARRDALQLLRRLERELEPAGPRRARSAPRRRQRARGTARAAASRRRN
jgi:hypothetical protein